MTSVDLASWPIRAPFTHQLGTSVSRSTTGENSPTLSYETSRSLLIHPAGLADGAGGQARRSRSVCAVLLCLNPAVYFLYLANPSWFASARHGSSVAFPICASHCIIPDGSARKREAGDVVLPGTNVLRILPNGKSQIEAMRLRTAKTKLHTQLSSRFHWTDERVAYVVARGDKPPLILARASLPCPCPASRAPGELP